MLRAQLAARTSSRVALTAAAQPFRPLRAILNVASDRSPTLTRRAAHATLWSALEISARYGVQFAVLMVLARLLTPPDFGLIAMLLVFTSVAAILVDGGFSTALIQKQRTSDDDETTVFLSGLGIACAAAAVLWIAAPQIATFYAQPQLTSLLRLLLWVLPISAMAAVPDALLTQRLAFRSRAGAETVASLGAGSVAIGLAWQGSGARSLAWQALVAAVLRALLLWHLSRWRPRGRFSIWSLRRLFGFGGYMLLANLLNVSAIRLQSLLIGKFFSSRTLGLYTVAQNTQQAPALLIGNLLSRVGLPVFSSVSNQPTKLLGAFKLSLRVSLFAFLPSMVCIAIAAKPLIAVMYGAQWTPAANLLSILTLAVMFWPLHALNIAAVAALGRSDLMFRLEIAKQATSMGLIVIASFYGVTAVALAVLASSLLAIVVNTWYSRRLLGYGLVAQLRDQAGTFLLTAVAALAAYVPIIFIGTDALKLLVSIAVAAATYLGAAVIWQHPAVRETADLVRGLRHGTNRASQ